MHFFPVKTDFSAVTLGEVLSQKKEDGKVHAIQFASRTMTEEESQERLNYR